jgi:hypothetical protein
LNTTDDFWAIRVDRDHFRVATTPDEADLGHAVNLTSKGSPTFHLIRHGFPRTVNISRNRFSTFRPVRKGEHLIIVNNASTVSFRDNDIVSYAGEDIPIALKFEAKKGVRKRPLSGWDAVGNRFRGDARLDRDFDVDPDGSFGIGVSMSAGNDVVSHVRVADNTFSGCVTQVQLDAETGAGFRRAPSVSGNIGEGEAVVLAGSVKGFLVGGNLASVTGPGTGTAPAGARYCGKEEPTFDAPIGSLYSRVDGTVGQLLYINTDGAAGWAAIA